MFTRFPLGKIQNVGIHQNQNLDVVEATMRVGSQDILLNSGEIYGNWDGSISTKSDDESFLIFLQPKDAEGVKFNT